MAISKIPSAGFQDNVKFRNLVINGSMDIAQRGTSVTGITSGAYRTADRFYLNMGTAGTWTNTISTDVPTGQGFAKSFKLDCTTANASLSSGSYMTLQHRIEAQNLQYIKKGTANAESLTLSFWVKSAKTGTYIAYLKDDDNNRDISKSYTINSANTWEKKTITFPPDTTGIINNDNGIGLYIYFWLVAGSTYQSGSLQTTWSGTANSAVGQVNLADSTSNEWLITGVQLESGTASDFEFLPVDVNLNRCLRYYQLLGSDTNKDLSIGTYYTSTHIFGSIDLKQVMRATPSLDIITGTNYYVGFRNGSSDTLNTFSLSSSSQNNSIVLSNSSEASGTAGQGTMLRTNNANAFIAADSEL